MHSSYRLILDLAANHKLHIASLVFFVLKMSLHFCHVLSMLERNLQVRLQLRILITSIDIVRVLFQSYVSLIVLNVSVDTLPKLIVVMLEFGVEWFSHSINDQSVRERLMRQESLLLSCQLRKIA